MFLGLSDLSLIILKLQLSQYIYELWNFKSTINLVLRIEPLAAANHTNSIYNDYSILLLFKRKLQALTL